MIISGLIKSSLIDYPGKVAATVFTQGCDLDCFYCHNRKLIEKGQGTISELALLEFLKTRKGLLEGIVITGGEPLLQPDIEGFVQIVKKLGFAVKLDTNGQHPEKAKDLIEKDLVDYVAVDFKAPPSKYKEYCGDNADPNKTFDLIEYLREKSIEYQVRTTVIPQLTEVDLLEIARLLPENTPWALNEYRKPEIYRKRDKNLIEKKGRAKADLETYLIKIHQCQPLTIIN